MAELSETERLALVTDTVRHCRDMRDRGMPTTAWAKALREALHFTWERRGGAKHANTQYVSLKAEGLAARDLIYEHSVPLKILAERLLALDDITPAAVKAILDRLLVTVSVTRQEDLQLISLGLQSKMPANWDGTDPLARYAAAGIAIKARTIPSKKTLIPRPAGRAETAITSGAAHGEVIGLSLDDVLARCGSDVRRLFERFDQALIGEGLAPRDIAKGGDWYGRAYDRDGVLVTRIDPKLGKLRIKVTPKAYDEAPNALRRAYQQRDWLAVAPADAEAGIDFVIKFVGSTSPGPPHSSPRP